MANAANLCNGFQSVDFGAAEKPSDVIGAFYAVYPDGRVYSADITLAQYRTHAFNFKGAKWVESEMSADAVKTFAEFNGNYEFPVK